MLSLLLCQTLTPSTDGIHSNSQTSDTVCGPEHKAVARQEDMQRAAPEGNSGSSPASKCLASFLYGSVTLVIGSGAASDCSMTRDRHHRSLRRTHCRDAVSYGPVPGGFLAHARSLAPRAVPSWVTVGAQKRAAMNPVQPRKII